MDFREPVEVGSLLRLHSAVILTQPELEFPLLTVDIEAVVARPEQRCSIQCNTFTFTFSLERDEMVCRVTFAQEPELHIHVRGAAATKKHWPSAGAPQRHLRSHEVRIPCCRHARGTTVSSGS